MSRRDLPKILILKMGSAEPPIAAQHGDYEEWFTAGLQDGARRCHVVASFRGETMPRLEGYGGVILTGSPLSVRDQQPWMDSVARWALSAASAGIPVLAVCFGHQLLGEALGGRVERSPDGGEHGTVEVELTDEGYGDPLFLGLGTRLRVQATHQDALVRPPSREDVIRLAGNSSSAWQSFGVGAALRAVQFHPEIPPRALEDLNRLRGRTGRVSPTSDGGSILRNWDQHFVRRAEGRHG